MNISTDTLREQIIKMAALVEEGLQIISHPNTDQNKVYELEEQINHYHTEIDDLCFRYLALARPVAKDLRYTIAVMKINNDLERIGDEIINIKRYREYTSRPALPQIQLMLREVTVMLQNVVDSFVSQNVKNSTEVISHDQIINDLNRSVVQSFFEGVQEGNYGVNDGLNLVMVAKSLERIGDHATNIAEDVIFLVSGDDVRHPGPRFEEKIDSSEKKTTSENIVSFLSRPDRQKNNN